MPLCPLDNRKCVGNFHYKSSNYISDQVSQRNIIRYLIQQPGDPQKRVRAQLMLQSLLFISNVAGDTLPGIYSLTANKNSSSSSTDVSKPDVLRLATTSRHHNQTHLIPAQVTAHRTPLSSFIVQSAPSVRLGCEAEHDGVKSISPVLTESAPGRLSINMRSHTLKKRSVDDAERLMDKLVKAQTHQIKNWLNRKLLPVAGHAPHHEYMLINKCFEILQDDPTVLSNLARRLSKPSGNFGAHHEEILSKKIQNRIFCQWLEAVVFKPSVSEFISRTLVSYGPVKNEKHPSYTIEKVYSSIAEFLDDPDGTINATLANGLQLSQAAQSYIMNNVVLYSMPTLRFHNETEPFVGMDVGSVEWVYLHAGLSFAEQLGIDSTLLPKDEILQLGFSLEEMLNTATINLNSLFVFDMPAKIYVSRYSQPAITRQEISTLYHGVNASSNALEAFFAAGDKYKADQNPVNMFQDAIEKYQTRIKMAEDLNEATKLFKQQNEDIGAKFAKVDDILVAQAFSQLAPEELTFIASSQVKIIAAEFSAFDLYKYQKSIRSFNRNVYTIGLSPDVNLFSATENDERRIYALHLTEMGYQLKNVGQDPEHYFMLMEETITPRKDPDYKLKVYADAHNAPVVKNSGDTLEPLLAHLVLQHKQRMIERLHQFGYDETDGEKAIRVLLSFIPFYDCITGIREERRDAVIPCLIDGLALLPVAGKGIGITTRFAQRGTMGGVIALRANVGAFGMRMVFKNTLRRAGADLMRFAAVPASKELNRNAMIALCLAGVRTLDPGFELVGIGGARAVNQLVKVAKLMENKAPVWQKIGKWLEQRHPPSDTVPLLKTIETGRLHGLDTDIPIIKLGGDKLDGQDIYIRYNPVTNEGFGRKYTLLPNNVLQPVRATVAKKLRNILDQGISGRGSIAVGKQFSNAAGHVPNSHVTGVHLSEWLVNTLLPTPLPMSDFIAQRGITIDRWRSYVFADGTLTETGRLLLQSSALTSPYRLLQMSHDMQRLFLDNVDLTTLHELSRTFRPMSNEHPSRALLQQLITNRLDSIQSHYFEICDAWAARALSDEAIDLAVTSFKNCLLNKLPKLDLHGLGLRSLPAEFPPFVKSLDLSNNRLQTLQGTVLPDLMYLDISHNRFTELPRVIGANIEVMKAQHNQLTRLHGTFSKTLSELDVSDNQIKVVEAACLKELKTLRLNHNEIITLPNLSDLKLKSLYLDQNKLEVWPRLPSELTILCAAHNSLNAVGSIPITLRHLDLSYNAIEEIPDNFRFSKVRHLKLDNNLLEDVDKHLPPSLISFSANNNFIMDFSSEWPPDVTSISLRNNDITSLTDAIFPSKLKVLNLAENQIPCISVNFPASIEKIILANNKLKHITVNTLPNLKLVDVSHNFIEARPSQLAARVTFINRH